MCIETMDTTSKYIKITKPGSKLRLRLLRLSTTAEEDGDHRRNRAAAVRTTIRKYLRREQRRTQLAKLARIVADVGKKEKKKSPYEKSDGSPAVDCVRHLPAGAMAPRNTTQYLMSNVYEDMKADFTQSVLHEAPVHVCERYLTSVYTAPDSESFLAFQQKNFEEAFDQYW